MTDTPKNEDGLPEASFLNFCSGLASQALIQLGAIVHPATGERESNPAYARYTLDVLKILFEKTEGNRSDEETKYLEAAIADIQGRL